MERAKYQCLMHYEHTNCYQLCLVCGRYSPLRDAFDYVNIAVESIHIAQLTNYFHGTTLIPAQIALAPMLSSHWAGRCVFSINIAVLVRLTKQPEQKSLDVAGIKSLSYIKQYEEIGKNNGLLVSCGSIHDHRMSCVQSHHQRGPRVLRSPDRCICCRACPLIRCRGPYYNTYHVHWFHFGSCHTFHV